LKIGTQYDLNLGFERKRLGFERKLVFFFTIGLFILAGRSSAALQANGKGKGRILSRGKGNVAEGKGNIAEIEFKKFFYKFHKCNRFTCWITCMKNGQFKWHTRYI